MTDDATKTAVMLQSKFITKKDPYHVHKVGCFVLLLYTFRLASFGYNRMNETDSDMQFASYPEWTLPTALFLHLLLNLSYEFELPPRRIVS